MIFVTGDCHANFHKFNIDSFYEQKEMTKDDYVIICGDFGGVWDYKGENTSEKYWLDWLEGKPYTTLFVDGNHENFKRLYSYPEKGWKGGKIHEIRPSVLHLMRGEIFELQGKTFFTFGGASSHDISDGILDPEKDKEKIKAWSKSRYKMFRINEMSWWKEELPTEEEMQHGIETLNAAGNKVDFVISHCCPQSIASLFSHGLYKSDILTRYFDGLINNGLTFKNWFFGHYHDDQQIMIKYIMLYDQIIQIV